MITRIKEILKKNPKIETIFRYISYPIFLIQYLNSNISACFRKYGIYKSPEYQNIRKLKNTHIGERCFIVATGPSLTFDDLNLIKNEFCFGMNSGVLAFDKTSWRPSIYGVQDEYVYKRLETDIKVASKDSLTGRVYVSENLQNSFKVPVAYNIFPLHYLDHKMPHKNGFGKVKLSDDCYVTIYDGYSIIFSLLQIAIYMGFKEIYLLGCDCNYQLPKSHFIDYGHKDPHASIMGDKIIYFHGGFKKFADKKGVKVVNCTRGGMLEVYPRSSLEQVINQN